MRSPSDKTNSQSESTEKCHLATLKKKMKRPQHNRYSHTLALRVHHLGKGHSRAEDPKTGIKGLI
jgi:hypothetical protein